jgi:class 3 adenylate cyclase
MDEKTEKDLSPFSNTQEPLSNDQSRITYEFSRYGKGLPPNDDTLSPLGNARAKIASRFGISDYLKYGQAVTNKNDEKLESEINKLNIEIRKLREKLQSKEEKEEDVKELQGKIKELNELNELSYLLLRLHRNVSNLSLEQKRELLSNFTNGVSTEMSVLSIDIRKSTNLMFKADTQDAFANFIFRLTQGLKEIIIEHYGVFDKFTGDGILAYFPKFYSGDDGIINCCIAAQACHRFFQEFYEANYNLFNIILDTGLGIGIDHGMVNLLTINKEQIIIGTSVVYACRLSDAPTNQTYLNINAYRKMREYGITARKAKMEIKNEGTIIVFALEDIIDKEISIPPWAREIDNPHE